MTEAAATLDQRHEELLTGLVRSGLRWSFAGNVISKLSTLISGVVLAHILEPSDYGRFAVAVVALVLIASINDMGLEATIVRWPGRIDLVAPTAATLVFGSSLLLYAGCWLGAPLFTQSMNDPGATTMVRVLSLGLVINGAFAVPSAILTRSFQQNLRMRADLAGFFVSLGLTFGLAMLGLGAWSLVWGRLVGNAVNSLLHYVYARERHRFGWSPPMARELVASGLPIAGTTLLAVAMLNLDYIVVGRTLGPVELGFYVMAFNLSMWPVTMFSVAMARVSVAAFGRVQHDLTAVRAMFTRYLSGLMAVTIPVCVLLAVLALPLIRFVYGPRWQQAASALHFLVVVGAFRVASQLASDLLIAVGRGRTTLGLQALWIAVALPALSIGAELDGIRGVGIGHAIASLLVVMPAFLLALHRYGLRVQDLGRSLLRPAVGGALCAAVSLLALMVLDGTFVQLAVGGCLGLGAYTVVVAPMRATFRTPQPEEALAVAPLS